MSDNSDSKTELQDEEVINLFSDGFDDKSLRDEPAPDEDVKEGAPADEAQDDDLPEKYKGKSIKDVIDMHRHVEEAYGRGQNELGELRKLTDQILKQQLGETEQQARKKIDADAVLEDPEAAIAAALSDNPKVRELEAKLTARERAESLAAFNRKHPNAPALVTDPQFLAWVEASPTRQRLLQQADQTFDYELASEVLDMYEQQHPSEEANAQRDGDKQALKNAKPSAGSRSGKKKPIFKRAELMRLRLDDPDRYEKLQPEIQAAYAENRVR